jgi:aminoglycoside phosphotransferase (APT) family kinase protein
MSTDRWERLPGWLAQQADARSATLQSVSRLSGGAIQENWAIDVAFGGGNRPGLQRLVLRMDAPSRLTVSRSRSEEFALLQAAHAAGAAVPEPLWLCPDPSLLGTPFFIVRRLEGIASGQRLVADDSLVPDRARLAERLGRELARIHSITPPRTDLAFLGAPGQAPARALIDEFRSWVDRRGVPEPTLEWGLRWLERHAPPGAGVVLCHNDFRTGNYLVAEGELTGILDWEFAGWGDPLADIGWFCAPCWRFGRRAAEAGGIGRMEDFLQGYQAQSGTLVDRRQIPYWMAMGTMRWAVIALQQAERHLRGGEPSLELALTGHLVPELELDLLEMTREP